MRNGTAVTVRQHKRRGLDPSRSWRHIRRGWKHQQRGNSGRAVGWIGFGALGLVAYVLVGVTGLMLTVFGVFVGAVGMKMVKATRGETQ
jgi:hypothetical protein